MAQGTVDPTKPPITNVGYIKDRGGELIPYLYPYSGEGDPPPAGTQVNYEIDQTTTGKIAKNITRITP